MATVGMVTLVDVARWAEGYAEELLAPLGNRWRHTQGVVNRAREVTGALAADERPVLIAAAFLHDIGYAPSLGRLRLHGVDGAVELRRQGHQRLACLVAHHSGASFEALERGLADELEAFEAEEGVVADALTFCDMTTGPQGDEVSFDERVEEILARYPPDDPVHRSVTRARPSLAEAVERMAGRLRKGSVQPI